MCFHIIILVARHNHTCTKTLDGVFAYDTRSSHSCRAYFSCL